LRRVSRSREVAQRSAVVMAMHTPETIDEALVALVTRGRREPRD
jgi:hypothetical protein